MQPGALRALEFDRIVEAVTGFALTPMGAQRLSRLCVDDPPGDGHEPRERDLDGSDLSLHQLDASLPSPSFSGRDFDRRRSAVDVEMHTRRFARPIVGGEEVVPGVQGDRVLRADSDCVSVPLVDQVDVGLPAAQVEVPAAERGGVVHAGEDRPRLTAGRVDPGAVREMVRALERGKFPDQPQQ